MNQSVVALLSNEDNSMAPIDYSPLDSCLAAIDSLLNHANDSLEHFAEVNPLPPASVTMQ